MAVFLETHVHNVNVRCIFLFAAKPGKERPPTFLTPRGTESRKEELRGNVLSLECIAEGL